MDLNSNDKTPKRLLLGGMTTKKTPFTTPKNFVTRFNLLASNNANLTPSPMLKNRVVRNPFENQLHEKLHMPVISSPSSLFHAPSTPNKQNSGKLEVFEWTIEELSSFNPVNLIPHETQFREEMDPDREAEVQAAISSFFNEHQIVPSPKINSTRGAQKIDFKTSIYNSTALSELSNNKQVSSTSNSHCHISSIRNDDKKVVSDNKIKISRDNSTQTDLSFPPNLPKEIEELLNRFKIHDNSPQCTEKKDDKHEIEENDGDDSRLSDRSMMDISTLRRKLFIKPPESPDFHNASCTDDTFATHLSPAPKTPQLAASRPLRLLECDNNVIGSDNSLSSDMFGELSPISMPNCSFECSSPMSSHNDISMLSDVGRDNKTPATRRRCNLLKKKNLSESFSMLQNEFNEEDCSEQENCDLHITLPAMTEERKAFARFDSGFRGYSDDSNSAVQFNLSEELMQI